MGERPVVEAGDLTRGLFSRLVLLRALADPDRCDGKAYAWLKSTPEKIAGGHPQSRIRELLPWNFGPASN